MFEYFFGNSKLNTAKRILLERIRQYRLEGTSDDGLDEQKIALDKLTAPIQVSPTETLSYYQTRRLFESYGTDLPKKYSDVVQKLITSLLPGFVAVAEQTKQRAFINVNLNTEEFFIAITKLDFHSFVMLGVVKNGIPTLLARVGKRGHPDEGVFTSVLDMCYRLVSTTFAGESLALSGEVSYAAYVISYEQYLQFVELTTLGQGHKKIACYRPVEQVGPMVTLEFSTQNKGDAYRNAKQYQKDLIEKSHDFDLTNTCRHAAIDLIEYTRGMPAPDNISAQFFYDLPIKETFKDGKPDHYFYVLPQPPNAYSATKAQLSVLTKIYQRMEALVQKDPYGENTIEKFKLLKTLYQDQAGMPTGDISQMLTNVREWKARNLSVIRQFRSQSFFGKLFTTSSSTLIMANEIEQELQSLTLKS